MVEHHVVVIVLILIAKDHIVVSGGIGNEIVLALGLRREMKVIIGPIVDERVLTEAAAGEVRVIRVRNRVTHIRVVAQGPARARQLRPVRAIAQIRIDRAEQRVVEDQRRAGRNDPPAVDRKLSAEALTTRRDQARRLDPAIIIGAQKDVQRC